jgi:CO dehydrogenase maturation factor
MKKIAICGKGSSGKSVTVNLLANGLLNRHLKVLVVDSDESNTGLHRLLGFDSPPASLLDMMGGKQRVEDRQTALINAGESEMSIQLMKAFYSIFVGIIILLKS